MRFILKNTMELSDTSIPDIFICEYMKQLDFNSIKLYLFILYVNKSKKEMTLDNIAKMTCLTKDELAKALSLLEEKELLLKTEKEYIVRNIKELEIEKMYAHKINTSNKNQRKNDPERDKLFKAISNTFFAGNMPTRWYIEITNFIDKYKFDNDVILGLFTTCQKNNKLFVNYVSTIANAWHKAGIKTEDDLNEYYERQTILRKTENKIKKFFRTNNNLTEPEMKYVETWVEKYNFEYPVIEQALLTTLGKQNPLMYANKVLQNWNNCGVKTVEDIAVKTVKAKETPVQLRNNNTSNFEKRTYENLDSLFDNM